MLWQKQNISINLSETKMENLISKIDELRQQNRKIIFDDTNVFFRFVVISAFYYFAPSFSHTTKINAVNPP